MESPLRSKLYTGPAAALDGLLFDGMTIMSGGFGLSDPRASSLKSAAVE
jgi:acyl CoA:acetate/3-ketoacid CoA transferase alpha subunit